MATLDNKKDLLGVAEIPLFDKGILCLIDKIP